MQIVVSPANSRSCGLLPPLYLLLILSSLLCLSWWESCEPNWGLKSCLLLVAVAAVSEYIAYSILYTMHIQSIVYSQPSSRVLSHHRYEILLPFSHDGHHGQLPKSCACVQTPRGLLAPASLSLASFGHSSKS